jgi:3-hydroxybutyryl-CoA dehydratase
MVGKIDMYKAKPVTKSTGISTGRLTTNSISASQQKPERITRGRQTNIEILGYFLEDLEPDMEATFAKTISEAYIVMFSGVTGDMNPVHVNEEFARNTVFKGRIAHGMLTGSLISTVLGMKLPGPGSIYVSQTLKFLAPVRVGDTAEVHAIITKIIPERHRVVLKTTVHVGDVLVVDGEAKMMVSSRQSGIGD